MIADRLVILPDATEPAKPVVIPCPGHPRRLDRDVRGRIWTHMERWGMAVAGGYWKPVLKVR